MSHSRSIAGGRARSPVPTALAATTTRPRRTGGLAAPRGTARRHRLSRLALLLGLWGLLASSTLSADTLPWAAAGLDERQAAAHLLDRFTFGPRPGEVDRLLETGLEEWLEAQLQADLAEPNLELLHELRPLTLSVSDHLEQYPPGQMLLRLAQQEGVLPEGDEQARAEMQQPGARRDLLEWAESRGFHRQGELLHALLSQKVVRATAAENQLQEVLVDFWFNHFNVSLTDPQVQSYVLAYERDAIRPHVLGDFREMLGATARHPAMLLYLDNAQSSADEGAATLLDSQRSGQRARRGGLRGRSGMGNPSRSAGRSNARPPRPQAERPRQRSTGINENYARELLELHTLGVDGGYDQEDIVEVARAFTGWTILPPGPQREEAERRLARTTRSQRALIHVEGEFLFRPDRHDAASKRVLGVRLPANRGIEDGEQVLDLVARHPSTARHLATKLAAKFLADEPSAPVIDHLASVFEQTGGDLRAMVRAIAYSPEFWSESSRRQKIKSPFDLAISSVRAVGGEVDDAAGLVDWVDRMGQPLYQFSAPTGYPDDAASWTNAGALLTRMNFGLALAGGLVHGVSIDLEALYSHRQPESLQAGLEVVAAELLPGRPLEETIDRLRPILADPDLPTQVAQRDRPSRSASMDYDERVRRWQDPFPGYSPPHPRRGDDSALASMVGVLLGSPEFQRQ